jgi:hypothetical protein
MTCIGDGRADAAADGGFAWRGGTASASFMSLAPITSTLQHP